MNGQQLFNGLQSDNDEIIYKDIYSVTAVQLYSLINHQQALHAETRRMAEGSYVPFLMQPTDINTSSQIYRFPPRPPRLRVSPNIFSLLFFSIFLSTYRPGLPSSFDSWPLPGPAGFVFFSGFTCLLSPPGAGPPIGLLFSEG